MLSILYYSDYWVIQSWYVLLRVLSLISSLFFFYRDTKTKRLTFNYDYLHAQWNNSFSSNQARPLMPNDGSHLEDFNARVYTTSSPGRFSLALEPGKSALGTRLCVYGVYRTGFQCQRHCKERNATCSPAMAQDWMNLQLKQTRKRKKQKKMPCDEDCAWSMKSKIKCVKLKHVSWVLLAKQHRHVQNIHFGIIAWVSINIDCLFYITQWSVAQSASFRL